MTEQFKFIISYHILKNTKNEPSTFNQARVPPPRGPFITSVRLGSAVPERLISIVVEVLELFALDTIRHLSEARQMSSFTAQG